MSKQIRSFVIWAWKRLFRCWPVKENQRRYEASRMAFLRKNGRTKTSGKVSPKIHWIIHSPANQSWPIEHEPSLPRVENRAFDGVLPKVMVELAGANIDIATKITVQRNDQETSHLITVYRCGD